MHNIEALLEQKLNNQTRNQEEDDDEIAILSKIYILTSKYANCTGNQVILKCQTPNGSRVLTYNSQPKLMMIKTPKPASPSINLNPPQTLKSPKSPKSANSQKSPKASFPNAKRSHKRPFTNVQRDFRHLVLEHVRKDLKDPDRRTVPLRRLKVSGWPSDIPIKMTEHRIAHIQILTDLLESGKIRFELKDD